eukprot:gene3999-4354_t
MQQAQGPQASLVPPPPAPTSTSSGRRHSSPPSRHPVRSPRRGQARDSRSPGTISAADDKAPAPEEPPAPTLPTPDPMLPVYDFDDAGWCTHAVTGADSAQSQVMIQACSLRRATPPFIFCDHILRSDKATNSERPRAHDKIDGHWQPRPGWDSLHTLGVPFRSQFGHSYPEVMRSFRYLREIQAEGRQRACAKAGRASALIRERDTDAYPDAPDRTSGPPASDPTPTRPSGAAPAPVTAPKQEVWRLSVQAPYQGGHSPKDKWCQMCPETDAERIRGSAYVDAAALDEAWEHMTKLKQALASKEGAGRYLAHQKGLMQGSSCVDPFWEALHATGLMAELTACSMSPSGLVFADLTGGPGTTSKQLLE